MVEDGHRDTKGNQHGQVVTHVVGVVDRHVNATFAHSEVDVLRIDTAVLTHEHELGAQFRPEEILAHELEDPDDDHPQGHHVEGLDDDGEALLIVQDHSGVEGHDQVGEQYPESFVAFSKTHEGDGARVGRQRRQDEEQGHGSEGVQDGAFFEGDLLGEEIHHQHHEGRGPREHDGQALHVAEDIQGLALVNCPEQIGLRQLHTHDLHERRGDHTEENNGK